MAAPGRRRTFADHLPPAKTHFLVPTPMGCRDHATQEVGPACALVIDTLLGDRPLDRLRSAQGVPRLAQRFAAARLKAARARADAMGEYRYHTIKTSSGD